MAAYHVLKLRIKPLTYCYGLLLLTVPTTQAGNLTTYTFDLRYGSVTGISCIQESRPSTIVRCSARCAQSSNCRVVGLLCGDIFTGLANNSVTCTCTFCAGISDMSISGNSYRLKFGQQEDPIGETSLNGTVTYIRDLQGLDVGQLLEVTLALSDSQTTPFLLKTVSGDVGFQLNINLPMGIAVANSVLLGVIGTPQVYNVTFTPGTVITLSIIITATSFKIYSDSGHQTTFNHRVPDLSQYNKLLVYGDGGFNLTDIRV